MALKIFVSSVYHELSAERLALQEEIHKLHDLFVGMELFGSDPAKPADYCIQKVQESDLYVGLFGEDYGSIDATTGISFTQLEYEAAISKSIPCLIFFKASSPSRPSTDPALAALKERLMRVHVIEQFTDSGSLKVQFLRRFIKLLREDLFDKVIPAKRGAIPADLLLSLTQQSLKDQVKAVGQDKYIPELYVTREAEKEIACFTHFENLMGVQTATIFQSLQSISDRFHLGDRATEAIANARIAFKDVRESVLKRALDELKIAFYFQEVEDAVESLNSVILETLDHRFEARVAELLRQLRVKPFIHQGLLPDIRFLRHVRGRSSVANALDTSGSYQELLQVFPSKPREPNQPTELANDLLKHLSLLSQVSLKRCLVLVDSAGTGKTNIVCHLAEQLAVDQPVILLSGHMELSSEYDIEAHIQRQLEATFSGIFTDWIPRVSAGLQDAGKWLFIIIDGINENTRRPLFIKLLKGLLPKLENRRIKLILTCRDLSWDVFRDTIEPHLFENVIALNRFSDPEWHEAIDTYFKKFNVECTLSKEAREALRDPLLLRFFCEANRNGRLGFVSNLRLLSVFHLYVDRIGHGISERNGLLRPDAMLRLLLAVANKMWQQRSVAINLDSVDVREREKSERDSVYNLVLSENIILEESTHLYSTRKLVRFLYDEFMEYVIARSWVDQISGAADKASALDRLVQEAAESLGVFPPALGSILFLDKMLDRSGQLINDLIVKASKLDELVLSSQQTSIVYAFESVDFARADDELMAVIEKFEPLVRPDLRERVAAVVLKIFKAHPEREYARKYVHQVLEVDQRTPATEPDSNSENATEKKDDPPPGLPPARYHYSEDTRINAIGLLVQLKDKSDYDVIDDGIRKLGRSDLNSALQALHYLDLAGNELLFKTISSYINSSQPEYRIYCAWLLRERYGKEPACFLLQLLTDVETRVHRYTANLFETRVIEQELIEEILTRIDSDLVKLKPWHLTHFIRLLGKRQQFYPRELAAAFAPRIVAALMPLLNHAHGSIRLEVYRMLKLSPSFINVELLKEKMQQDSDVDVRSLGKEF